MWGNRGDEEKKKKRERRVGEKAGVRLYFYDPAQRGTHTSQPTLPDRHRTSKKSRLLGRGLPGAAPALPVWPCPAFRGQAPPAPRVCQASTSLAWTGRDSGHAMCRNTSGPVCAVRHGCASSQAPPVPPCLTQTDKSRPQGWWVGFLAACGLVSVTHTPPVRPFRRIRLLLLRASRCR